MHNNSNTLTMNVACHQLITQSSKKIMDLTQTLQTVIQAFLIQKYEQAKRVAYMLSNEHEIRNMN